LRKWGATTSTATLVVVVVVLVVVGLMSLAFQLLPKCVVFSLGRKRGDDKKERSGIRILRGAKKKENRKWILLRYIKHGFSLVLCVELGAAYLSLCKYKKWVVKESVLLRRREGDDMLTHPHNKVSKLHSKEPHNQPIFRCRFFRCFLSVSVYRV
jgi:hypothetical protein